QAIGARARKAALAGVKLNDDGRAPADRLRPRIGEAEAQGQQSGGEKATRHDWKHDGPPPPFRITASLCAAAKSGRTSLRSSGQAPKNIVKYAAVAEIFDLV